MALYVVDYKLGGNLFSVLNSLDAIGVKYHVSSDLDELKQASKIIFPGVGNFAAAAQSLENLKLKGFLKERIEENTPFLGVCVGMQLLFDTSTEPSDQGAFHDGIAAIPGTIDKLSKKADYKIPHMGWNQVKISSSQNPLFKGVEDNSDFYFVHSFAYNFNADEKILAKYPKAEFCKTSHSEDFASSFWNGEALFATQFHPEKSAKQGLQILKNFTEVDL